MQVIWSYFNTNDMLLSTNISILNDQPILVRYILSNFKSMFTHKYKNKLY